MSMSKGVNCLEGFRTGNRKMRHSPCELLPKRGANTFNTTKNLGEARLEVTRGLMLSDCSYQSFWGEFTPHL
jgi:hypothetical protein